MPTSRLCGGASEMSRSPNQISPQSGRMKPASTINSVVLPEPEGPSSVMNSPLAISRPTLSRAFVRPYVLVTSRIEIGRAILVALFIGADNPCCHRAAWGQPALGQRTTGRRPRPVAWISVKALLLHEGIKALDHFVVVLGPPIQVHEEALADILRRVGELLGELLGDKAGLEGGEVGRRIVDKLGQACL